MKTDGLHARLDRFQSLIATGKEAALRDAPPERYRRMASEVGAELCSNHAGTYCLQRSFCPQTYVHGRATLGSIRQDSSLPLSAFSSWEETGSVDTSSLLFLDIETTGLGGAGVVAFLVGCGSFVEGGLEIRQYLIPDYSDETAMLEALLDELSADRTLVTYNGKAFDLPILRDRMIINRVAREIELAGHIDLLHASRRLFKRRLSDCTLVNMERQLFGFHRQDDIPGYLIPSIYFDWLCEQRLDAMAAVLEHNRLDIATLGFLANHIACAFQSRGETLDECDDLYSLARVYGRWRKNEQVIDICHRINRLENALPGADVSLFLARAFKRAGRFEQAVRLWHELAMSPSKESYWANLELAKYYEHKTRDFARALKHARTAKEISPYGSNHLPNLRKRISRLARKMAR